MLIRMGKFYQNFLCHAVVFHRSEIHEKLMSNVLRWFFGYSVLNFFFEHIPTFSFDDYGFVSLLNI